MSDANCSVSAATVSPCGSTSYTACLAYMCTCIQCLPGMALSPQAVGKAVAASQQLTAVSEGRSSQLWLEDKGALSQGGLAACSALPAGAECAVVQHVAVKGKPAMLIVFSERPR